MGHLKIVCNGIRKRLNGIDDADLICDCAWELKSCYAITIGLGTLEAKRICLLFFGIFVDWHVLYFAGGFIPVVLTLVAATIGLPIAAAIVYTIHKRRRAPCLPILSALLKFLIAIVIVCALLNIAVMLTIGFYVSISSRAVDRAFNASMARYSSQSWYKTTVDEIQFKFQCCGHRNYYDWVKFDWQRVDYASRDDMSRQRRLSDEEFRPLAVPYSCCRLSAMVPCFHTDVTMDVGSVNRFGCARILSRVLTRAVVITYCVTILLVVTQLVVIFLLTKISQRCSPKCSSPCSCSEKSASIYPLLESSTSCVSSVDYTSESDRNSSCCRVTRNNDRSVNVSPSSPNSQISRKSSVEKNSTRPRSSDREAAARIRPSIHTEHRVPKRRGGSKRARAN